MKYNFIIAALISASTYSAMAANWIQDDIFIGNGFFFDTNYLEKATKAEENKEYKSAAKSYEQLFNILTKTPNKAKALYLKAVNLENSGNFYESMVAYKEQVNRFNDGSYFAPSLEALQRLGNYFRDNKDKWFSSNRDHAIDAYQTFLKVAPYYKSAPQVALDLAILQESGLEIDKAIDHYEEIISKYQYDAQIKATSLINLANICEKEAKMADNDVEISRRGIKLVNQFMQENPNHSRTNEAIVLKQGFEERIAKYYLNIGEFYTWKVNYAPNASKRALQRVLLTYTESSAANQAEALLNTLDPDYKTQLENSDATKISEQRKTITSTKIISDYDKNYPGKKNSSENNQPDDSDKWLLPLPNIGE